MEARYLKSHCDRWPRRPVGHWFSHWSIRSALTKWTL